MASDETDNALNIDGDLGMCGRLLWVLSGFILVLFFPFSLCYAIRVVQEYERAILFRLGRVVPGGPKGPGLFFIWPCIDTMQKVDLRTVSFDVPPQEKFRGLWSDVHNFQHAAVMSQCNEEYLDHPTPDTILTKDSVTVAVDAVVYFRIFDPVMAVCNVHDAQKSTRLLAATTLRNVLGTRAMSEVLSERESISHEMQRMLDESTDPWGMKVERVEVKDVRLPIQLQRAMAAEAEATREARAKVVAAEGEQKASRALKEAADVMTESPAALQLRYLQTLQAVSAEKNSTIIFPLPIDMLSSFMKK